MNKDNLPRDNARRDPLPQKEQAPPEQKPVEPDLKKSMGVVTGDMKREEGVKK